jgi:hypothetical protein
MNKTDYNYGRALTWTAFMTYLSHCHPSFENVFAIEAVNEPLMNATQTPGLGECKSRALSSHPLPVVRKVPRSTHAFWTGLLY